MKRALVLFSLLVISACVPATTPPPPPPPSAPPVAAVPAGAHVFTVYFAWNRSWIGPESMGILQQAAAVFRGGGIVTLQVTGYTDTSGSRRYNQRLSERRAQHVAQLLTRMGVPGNAMRISGRGEDDLAVPTPDGVRDPRNRRVTIIE